MCGRFTLTSDGAKLAEAFPGIVVPEHMEPRYNIAPTQPVVAVLNDGKNTATFLRWGLIPHWAKDPKVGHKMINARAESLAVKPSFFESFRKRRCLVLADGFFEWKKDAAGKVPIYIRLKTGRPFAFAGLWDTWRAKGEEIVSCTIITTNSNELVAQIHDRMPVIIAPGGHASWIDPKERKPDDLKPLLVPYTSTDMIAYEVSNKVNNPKVEGPECVVPIA